MKMTRRLQVFLVLLSCATLSITLPVQEDGEEVLENMIDIEPGEDGLMDIGTDPDQLTDYLTSLLADENSELPLVYLPEKRSRYYRRYPWKRQNQRNYDPDSYLCTPTRQDVFHLLMALHDARSGNHERQVHFCNRRRPARAIFTNIRFLGRR